MKRQWQLMVVLVSCLGLVTACYDGGGDQGEGGAEDPAAEESADLLLPSRDGQEGPEEAQGGPQPSDYAQLAATLGPTYDSGLINLTDSIAEAEYCDGRGGDNITWTNAHWKLHLAFDSPVSTSGVYAMFCGDFDFDRWEAIDEDLAVSLNGAAHSFYERTEYYGGFRRFLIPGVFNVYAGTNNMEIAHPSFPFGSPCGNAGGGSIHFEGNDRGYGWFRLSNSGGAAMTLRAVSAGRRAGGEGYFEFYKNGVQFDSGGGGGGGHRGFNIAVINSMSGAVEAQRNFDTWLDYDAWEAAGRRHDELCNMAGYLSTIESGKVIMIAVADEAGFIFWAGSGDEDDYPWPGDECVETGYAALEALGSGHIREVGFQGSWAMIAVKGAPNVAEGYHNFQAVDISQNFGGGSADSDGDDVGNLFDVCPDTYDPDQANFDNDCFGNVCDDDDDNDSDPDGSDCAPLNSAIHHGAAEICDRVDNDCNGIIDDGVDNDGDGFSPCYNDCNDSNAAISPAAEEICDGIDNNCDNLVDERPCGSNVGECSAGRQVCVDGSLGDCIGYMGPTSEAESRCDCEDNDCNGLVDDGCDICPEGGVGGDPHIACEVCIDVTVCLGYCPEVCDGWDNDSDGEVDEGFDADGDGIANCFDVCPYISGDDLDGDGICASIDNCPEFANPDQLDTDGDGRGDACD